MDMTVANTIRQQLGTGTLFMLGAKNLTTQGRDLAFKIGRNAKGVTHIKIVLNGLDLYDVTFWACRGGKRPSITTKAEHTDLYTDMLHGIIESETGMYTRL